MRLTIGQEAILVKWFNTHRARGLCPVCESTEREWDTGEIVKIVAHITKDMDTVGREIPMLQLVCSNCGAIRLFDAVKLGLM
jgi:predicted Zn-ribbon and HTH transcriptional regulator